MMEELLSQLLSPLSLGIVLAIIFGGWLVASIVLTYHWHSYSKGSVAVRRARLIYYLASIIIFGANVVLIFIL